MNGVTLNDFRMLLGKVNDGNVVFNQDPQGKEVLGKVNYGRVFTHEKTPNSAEMNNRVRATLLLAIMNSVEGQSLQQKSLTAIATYLGISGDKRENFDKPLDRRQLKAIFTFIDNRATFDAMTDAQSKVIFSKGLVVAVLKQGVKNIIAGKREFATATGVVDSLCGAGKNVSFNGHSKAEIEKFVNGNLTSIQAHLYDRLFVMGYNITGGGKLPLDELLLNNMVPNLGALVRQVVSEMMEAYGRHEEPCFELDKLRGLAERKFFNVEVADDVADGLKRGFDKADSIFTALMPIQRAGDTDFRSLRLVRLNRYLLSTIKMDCNKVYLDNQNNIAKAQDCLQAFLESCGLDRITADEIRLACQDAPEPNLVTRFQDAFLDRIDKMGDVDQISPRAILKAFGEELRKIVDAADLEKALADHIGKEVLLGESPAECQRLAKQVLADPQVSAELRTQVRGALLKGDRAQIAVFGEAVNRAVAKRGQDADFVRTRYQGLAADAKKIMVHFKFAFEGVPEEEQQILTGKVIALALIKGEDALVEAGIVTRNASTGNLHFADSKEIRNSLSAMLNPLTADDVDFAFHYLNGGGYQMDGNYVETGERPFFDGLRDGVIPAREMSYFAACMLEEMLSAYNDRKGGMVDESPITIPLTAPPGLETQFNALMSEACGEDDEFKWQGDLGLENIGEMLKLLKNAGLSPRDIATADGLFRLQALGRFVRLGLPPDGLLEQIERIGGKSFAEMSNREIYETFCKCKADQIDLNDPLKRVTDDPNGLPCKTVTDFLQGKLRTSELGIAPHDLGALLKGLRALSAAASGASQTVTVRGIAVTFVKTPTGGLKASIPAPVGQKGEPRPVVVKVPLAAGALAILIENEIVANAKAISRELLGAILPAAEDGSAGVSRTRELCTKVICAKFAIPYVAFSGMPVDQLRAMALQAAGGTLSELELPRDTPQTYNSREAIELRKAMLQAPPEETDAIIMPAVPEARTRAERENLAPPPEAVRDFFADLVMNKDTWFFDNEKDAKSGERIRKVLVSWGPELKFILQDVDAALQNVPDVARTELRAVLESIRDLGDPEKASSEQCAALEAQVLACADKVLVQLQSSVTKLFAAKVGPDKMTWEKSLGELSGGNGLDINTPNGAFVRAALDKYFVQSGPVEKRAMLSAFLRKTDGDTSEASQVAELLKGAGPILQKMLQGLPLESFGPETQAALKDMKSNLPPIPEDVVKAQLLELKRASGGEITSIEFVRTIGAATVGEAILCRIKTKEHPVSGEEVVIKLLRPNVTTAAQREYAFFMSVAAQQGNGMVESFQSQYDGILEEMDFTHEAENIDLGVQAYERPKGSDGTVLVNVRSLNRHSGVLPLTGALVLTKVEGQTYDSYIRSAQATIREASGARPFALPGSDIRLEGPATNVAEMSARRQAILDVRNQAAARRELVMRFSDAWLNEALLGGGFLHGDLHAGNLMTDGSNVSVIDYGNALRLTEEQQKGLLRMLTCSMAGDVNDFVKAVGLMPPGLNLGDTETASLKAELKDVFARGTMLDGVSRLSAALACVQRAGVGLPPAVTCFIQSLARLKAVVTGLDDVIREAESTIGAVKVQLPPDRPQLTQPLVLGNVDLDEALGECLVLENGVGASGPDVAALRSKREQLKAVLGGAGAADEIARTLQQGGVELVQSFVDRYANFTTYYESFKTMANPTQYTDVVRNLEKLKTCQPQEAEGLYKKIAASMISFYDSYSKDMLQRAEREAKVKPLDSFEEMCSETVTNDLGKTIKKMTGKTVDMNQNDLMLGASILVAFGTTGGTFGVPLLKGGAKKALENRKQFAARLETAKTRHGARPAELLVAPRIQLAFDEIGREVRVPQAGLPKATDTAGLVSVLRANLQVAREMRKRVTGTDTPLTKGELAYLADVLNAGTNNKLAEVLKSAKDVELDAMLAQEGEDAEALQILYRNLIA